MLSSAVSPADSSDLETGLSPGVAPPLLFSEDLINRWLEEGERLNQQAAPAEAPRSRLARWRQRAAEIGHPLVERHRLELLVAAGLIPLALLLVTQRGGQRPSTTAAPARVAVASVAALAPRVVRSAKLDAAAPDARPVVHRRKPVAQRPAGPAPTVGRPPAAVVKAPAPTAATAPAKPPAPVVAKAPAKPPAPVVAKAPAPVVAKAPAPTFANAAAKPPALVAKAPALTTAKAAVRPPGSAPPRGR